MCGILGIISGRSDHELDMETVLAMRDTMTDRGPDGAGVFREANVTLGHRRLAIRDAENGHQPWISQNGRFAIVYNGEIYNDQELAASLRQAGVRLKTNCDTEVLAEAWSLWGEQCIERLRGMFAFGVVDRKSGKVWLVRDRFGIKPLFYANVADDFVFASSIAAIRKHPKFSSQPNFAAISHYMQTLRITLGAETVFKNIYTMLPSEVIKYHDQKKQHRFYWDLPTSPQTTQIGFEEAAHEMGATLQEAVRLHLKSDVEVGMMMSGGVDSNTLASITKRYINGPIVGVCGGGIDEQAPFPEASDFSFASDCAGSLGFDYSEVRLTGDDYLDAWKTLVGHLETPLATPTDAIIFRIAQRLKRSCGVALGGEGADEAFCGYAVQHWSGNDFDRSQNMRSLNSAQAEQFRNGLRQQYGLEQFDSIAQHYLSANTLIPWSAQRALFSPALVAQDAQSIILQHYENTFSKQRGSTAAESYTKVLLQINLESLLRRLDTSTMAAGLEARVPYADHKVVENSLQLPQDFRIDVCPKENQAWQTSAELNSRGSLRSKRLLRHVASQLLPPRLALRPKMSFPTPLASWLGSHWQAWISNKMRTSSFAQQIFRPEALAELAKAPASISLWKWPVLNTIIWGEQCFE